MAKSSFLSELILYMKISILHCFCSVQANQVLLYVFLQNANSLHNVASLLKTERKLCVNRADHSSCASAETIRIISHEQESYKYT